MCAEKTEEESRESNEGGSRESKNEAGRDIVDMLTDIREVAELKPVIEEIERSLAADEVRPERLEGFPEHERPGDEHPDPTVVRGQRLTDLEEVDVELPVVPVVGFDVLLDLVGHPLPAPVRGVHKSDVVLPRQHVEEPNETPEVPGTQRVVGCVLGDRFPEAV